MDALFRPGSQEAVKGGVHLLMHSLAASAALYNASAWAERREPHLAVNVAVYAALAMYEVVQVFKHFHRL